MRLFFACCAMMVTTLTHGQAYDADAPIDRETRGKVLDACSAALRRAYIFEDMGERMAQALQDRKTSGAYEQLDRSRAFAIQVTLTLQAISNDKHLWLVYRPEGKLPSIDTPAGQEARALRERVEREGNFGFERVERLEGNVGYLEIRWFSARANEVASAAMNFLAQADALIIDLRRNGGGNPGMVALVTSYLFDERVHLNDQYWREPNRTDEFWTRLDIAGRKFGGTKPVFVLTSSTTASAGEEFAYNLQALKRATIVGEPTWGGAHPVREEFVAEHFMLQIPGGRSINPITKSNWEGKGVIPDVLVSAGSALDKARGLALSALHDRGDRQVTK